jgi:uncharacterized protein
MPQARRAGKPALQDFIMTPSIFSSIRIARCCALASCLVAALVAFPIAAGSADFGAAPPRPAPKAAKPPASVKLPPATDDIDLRQAYAAYERGDAAAAYTAYLRAARRGQPIGQYNVAVMAFNGEGTKRDLRAATTWLTRAANQGFALAQYNLGLLYENGDGVERSQTKASAWFLRAAEQGHVDAQLAVATQYLLGRGIAKSDALAARWYERAANNGNVDAQYSIASCYEHGDGVAVDLARAIHWYAEAGKQGDRAAIEKVRVLSKAAALER